MTLPSYTLNVDCGLALTVTLPVLDGSGNPVAAASLSSARAQVRPAWNSELVLHEWSTATGNATISNAGVTLTATAAETELWQARWPSLTGAVWDLDVVDSSAVTRRVTGTGTVILNPTVTR